jgi:hypothetical protein
LVCCTWLLPSLARLAATYASSPFQLGKLLSQGTPYMISFMMVELLLRLETYDPCKYRVP